MRRLLFVAALAVTLGYIASPFYALWSLSQAVAARDTEALVERVDFDRLGTSLSRQIAERYLVLTGQDKRLSPLARSFTVGFSASIADPFVAEFVNPQGLLTLLDQGWPSSVSTASPPAFRGIGSVGVSDLLNSIGSADFGVRTFSLSLPGGEPQARRFSLHLRLVSWRWKLVGVDLPDEIKLRFAEVLAKRRPASG
jgi:hypothetical protein